MRYLIVSLALLFAGDALATTAEPPPAPQTEERDGPPGLFPRRPGGVAVFRKNQRERIEEDLVGAWNLIRYDRHSKLVEQGNVRGFVMFQEDGFMTMTLQLRALEPDIFGNTLQFYIQSGAYRYRVSEQLRLQCATIMGYSNANERTQLRFEPASFPREYDVTVTKNELILRRFDGDTMTFHRMQENVFPQRAIDVLERTRGREIRTEDWVDVQDER